MNGNAIIADNPQKREFDGFHGVSPSLMAEDAELSKIILNGTRIRKFTPRECFRLMGVAETDIDKIQATGLSDARQYNIAGNSIVVDVLFHVFRKLFVDKDNEVSQQTLF